MIKHLYNEQKHNYLFAFIVGILAHLFKFILYLPTWDSMYGMEHNALGVLQSGRWFYGISKIITSSPYDLQWVSGVISTVFSAATIILILSIFQIKKKINCYLLIILFMVFPTLASTYCYMDSASAYTLSFLLAILSVYLCINNTKKMSIVISILCICLSLSIYQIYMTTAVICFLYYIILLIIRKENNTVVFKHFLRYCIAALSGLVLYIAITLIITNATSITVSYYHSSSEGLFSFGAIPEIIHNLIEYCGFFHIGKLKISIYAVLNLSLLIIIGFLWLKLVILNKKYSIFHKVIVSLLLGATIIISYIFLFISKDIVYHMVMHTGNYFIYLGLFILLEYIPNINLFIKRIALTVVCILCFYHFINNNIGYKRMEMSYQKSCFVASELLVRIDEIATGNEKLVFIGQLPQDEELLVTTPSISGASDNSFLRIPYHYYAFFKYYYGRSFKIASEEECVDIKKSPIYADMGVYPYDNWVIKSGDLIIVNFSNNNLLRRLHDRV